MSLRDHLSSAREKYAKFTGPARELYKKSIYLREMPDGECQVIRFIGKDEWERPDVRANYESGALILARGKSWKELGV